MRDREKRIARPRAQRRPTFLILHFSLFTSSRGFSLAELLVVISISSALFLSLTAALSGTLSTTTEVAGQLSAWHTVSSALLQMERELALATQVVFPGNERILFFVPDITGDGSDDLIAYSWDSSDGGSLVRTVNGASPTDLLPEARAVRFSYNYRNRESHGMVTASKALNVVAASFDKYAAHGYQSVFRPIESWDWQAQSFVPAADTHQTDSVEFNLRAGPQAMFGVGHLMVTLAEVETGQSIAMGLLQASDIQQADDMQTFTVPMISMMGESSGTSTEKEYRLELKPMGFSYAGEVELLTVTDPEGPDNFMRYEWSINGGMSFMNIGNMGDIPFVTHGTYVVQYGVNAEHTVWRLGRVSIYLRYGNGKDEVAINSAVRMHNAK